MLKNYIYLLAVLLGFLLVLSSFIEISNQGIKSINEAMYSPKRLGGEIGRDIAIKDHLSTSTTFDEDGNYIEFIQYEDPTKIYRKRSYERDKKGEMKLIKVYNGEDKLMEKIKFSSNKKKSTSSQETYKNGKLSNVFHIELDDQGNEIKTINESITNSKKWLTENEYNDKNELIKSIRIFPDGKTDTRTYEYDEKGNETKSTLIKAEGKETLFLSIYDHNNNMIEQNWYNQAGEHEHKTSFEYTYDEKNNWITKKRFSNDELGLIWEREIEYY